MSHHTEIPVAVITTYVVGYVAGRWIAVLWTRGPVEAHGVRRLAGGAAEIVHRHPTRHPAPHPTRHPTRHSPAA